MMRFRPFALAALALVFSSMADAADDKPADGLPPGARVRLGTPLMDTSGRVQSMVLSPDGKVLAISGTSEFGVDVGIRLYDVMSAKEIRVLKAPRIAYILLLFSADGKKLLAGADNGCTLFEVATGNVLHDTKNLTRVQPL